jgi:hypothetical protein
LGDLGLHIWELYPKFLFSQGEKVTLIIDTITMVYAHFGSSRGGRVQSVSHEKQGKGVRGP